MQNIKVIVRKLNREYLEENYEKLVQGLYRERREKMAKFKRREAAHVSLLAGLLLQDVVESQCGILPENLELERSLHGKPRVKGTEDFYFNLTHSGDYVVIAYGKTELGVDVERNRHKDLRVARRCYTDAEYRYVVGDLSEEQQGAEECVNKRFFRIWTMKESYLKFTGQGISVPLNSFEIDVENGKVKNQNAFFQELEIQDYHIAVCSKERVDISCEIDEDWCKNQIKNG